MRLVESCRLRLTIGRVGPHYLEIRLVRSAIGWFAVGWKVAFAVSCRLCADLAAHLHRSKIVSLPVVLTRSMRMQLIEVPSHSPL